MQTGLYTPTSAASGFTIAGAGRNRPALAAVASTCQAARRWAPPRRYPRSHALLALGVLGTLLFCTPMLAAATATSDAAAKLTHLRSRIAALDKRLNQTRMQHDQLATRLRATELHIAEVTKQLAALHRELDAKRARLAQLNDARNQARAALARQRKALARQIRASYVMGREDYLKVLLNQQDPALITRMLTYFGYFNRARAHLIAGVEAQLQHLDQLARGIRQETAALATLQARQQQEREELQQQRSDRRTVLAKLARELRSGDQRLSRLRANEKSLEQLLAGLREEMADIPKSLDQGPAFAALKGRLPWPIRGRILHRFGSSRSPGGLKWTGDWIAAPAGEKVRAVARGRVAYADWLGGFGLLLIIDHGNGYMSLYGHNQALYKEVGDWVEAGEVIATVGDSGGSAKSGLYFEIRRDGTPVDPTRWCRSSAPVEAALATH